MLLRQQLQTDKDKFTVRWRWMPAAKNSRGNIWQPLKCCSWLGEAGENGDWTQESLTSNMRKDHEEREKFSRTVTEALMKQLENQAATGDQ